MIFTLMCAFHIRYMVSYFKKHIHKVKSNKLFFQRNLIFYDSDKPPFTMIFSSSKSQSLYKKLISNVKERADRPELFRFGPRSDLKTET